MDDKFFGAENISKNNVVNSGKGSQPNDYVIIMDLDGTLIDSDTTNFQLLYGLLKKYHFEDKIKIIMDGLAKGTHFDKIMELIEMPLEIRKKMDVEMTESLKNEKYKLIDGVMETLPHLIKNGFKLAIATDNYFKTTIKFLNLNNIKNYFDDNLILASDNFQYQKPHRKVIEEIFKRANTNKGLLIGNSSKEIDFAKTMGIPILLLNNFSNINSNDQTIMYYQKIRQLNENENYPYIYKAQSWKEIYNTINIIIKDV